MERRAPLRQVVADCAAQPWVRVLEPGVGRHEEPVRRCRRNKSREGATRSAGPGAGYDPPDRQEPLLDLAERDRHGGQAVVETVQAPMHSADINPHVANIGSHIAEVDPAPPTSDRCPRTEDRFYSPGRAGLPLDTTSMAPV